MRRAGALLLSLACLASAHAAPPSRSAKAAPAAAPSPFDLHHGDDYLQSAAPTAPDPEALAAQAEALAARGDDAGAREIIARYLAAAPDGPSAEELAFWRAFCAYRMKDPKAEDELRAFLKLHPQGPRAFEARRTLGLLERREGKAAEAAKLFDRLAADSADRPHRAAEARLLAFLARAEAADPVLRAEAAAAFPALAADGACDQPAALEMGALRLGSGFLDAGDAESALSLLRFLRPRAALDSAQQERRSALKEESLSHPEEAAELGALQDALAKDLASLDAVPDYDAAWRLRAASAYARTGRQREAALLLADALPSWPASSKAAAATQLAAAYAALERWPETLRAVDAAGEPTPALRLLRAQAQQNLGEPAAAIATLQALRAGPPSPENERAGFLLGRALLQAGRPAEAEAAFAALLRDYPKTSFREAAVYWTGRSLYDEGKYKEARAAWEQGRAAFPAGSLRAECLYWEARARCAAKDYAGAAEAVEAFRKEFPDGPEKDEAAVLLADCRLAVGRYAEGIALLEQATPSGTSLSGYAALRLGAAREALGREADAAAGYAAFLKAVPESPSAPELLARAARIDLRSGREADALSLLLGAAEQSGDGPNADPLFLQLAALGRIPALRPGLDKALDGWSGDAARPSLAARACWTQSRLANDPKPALLRGAALDAPHVGPALRADFADALREAGRKEEARAAYEALLPTAQAARGHAGLGLLRLPADPEGARTEFQAAAQGAPDAALAPAWKAWAELDEKAGRAEAARSDWERLLALPGLPAATAVAALNHLGDLYLASGHPEKAIPCYQRIYVMYGRWPDYVARAYWESGQAFEKLDRKPEAVATYKELAGRSDLASFTETALARQRLKELAP